MRKLISIRIDPRIYQTAREMGLNISKTCENSLETEIQRFVASNRNLNCGEQSDFCRVEPGMGVEPIYSGSAGRRLTARPPRRLLHTRKAS